MSARAAALSQLPIHQPAAATRIEVKALDKCFGSRETGVVAVDQVSFKVGKGEFVALLGPSGCGK